MFVLFSSFVLVFIPMNYGKGSVFGVAVAALLAGGTIAVATAQSTKVVTKQPTAADWTTLAKLPDFNGVWERGGGGGAPPGGAAAGGAPQGGAGANAGAGAPGAARGGAAAGGAG